MTTSIGRRDDVPPRSVEAEAFLTAIDSTPANGLTACRGWTMHDIVAHLTAGAVAIADQAEAFASGDDVPPFGSWEERDEKFRAIAPAELRRRFEVAESRMTRALVALDPGCVIPDGGWGFTAKHLLIHMRQECALHRWDLVGDDEISDNLLAQYEFVEHSVTLLNQWLLARGLEQDLPSSEPFRALLRSHGQPDVVVEVVNGVGHMLFDTERARDTGGAVSGPNPTDAGYLVADPAARLLFLWGRHTSEARRIRSTLPVAALARITTLLAGF